MPSASVSAASEDYNGSPRAPARARLTRSPVRRGQEGTIDHESTWVSHPTDSIGWCRAARYPGTRVHPQRLHGCRQGFRGRCGPDRHRRVWTVPAADEDEPRAPVSAQTGRRWRSSTRRGRWARAIRSWSQTAGATPSMARSCRSCRSCTGTWREAQRHSGQVGLDGALLLCLSIVVTADDRRRAAVCHQSRPPDRDAQGRDKIDDVALQPSQPKY